jgi:sec-independent protein translocase protein TatB
MGESSGSARCAPGDRRCARVYPDQVFGLTFEKLLIIAVIAMLLLGPDRLPQLAASFGRLVRQVRDFAEGAKSRVREEMGPEFDEVDWKKLDPRQYDPRRIIREALAEEPTPPTPAMKPVSKRPVAAPGTAAALAADLGAPAVFDAEAT